MTRVPCDRSFRQVLRVVLIFTALSCSFISPVEASSITITRNEGGARASGDFFGTSLPPVRDEQTFGPFGGVAVAEVGRTRAAQTGSGLNAVNAEARLSDVPSFVFRAETDIELAVENSGSVFEDLAFDYLINGGELRLFSGNGNFDGLASTVAVSIFTIAPDFSGFLWDWGVTLRGVGASVVAEVHGFAPIFSFNDPLSLGMPAISGITVNDTEAILSIAPFNAFVDLGALSSGGTGLVSYSMYAETGGSALNLAGGKATIGDPFDFTGSPGSIISIPGVDLEPTNVPEPISLASTLFGLAVLGLGAAIRGLDRKS
jgi:hypothetical protein